LLWLSPLTCRCMPNGDQSFRTGKTL
ncbi:hypothetical protein VC116063_000350B, partial [Vibrio cholerae O1 str. 116063]